MYRRQQLTPEAVQFASSLRDARLILLAKARDDRDALIDTVCAHLRRDTPEIAERVGDYLRWRRL